jgi:hypothetical protein
VSVVYSLRVIRLLAAAILCCGALMGLADHANAITANIHIANTGGEGVFLRAEPNTSSTRLGWMGEGTSPDYQCFVYGQVINGVPIWFNVTHSGITGYYASYFDDSSYHSDAELTAKYGIPRCGDSPPSPPPAPPPSPAGTPPPGSSSPASPAPATTTPSTNPPVPRLPVGDLCIARFPSGIQRTYHVFGGTETRYDRQSSLFHVCEGFGVPEGFQLTPEMQCALIAAAATFGGPVVSAGTSGGCDLVGIASAYSSGRWLGAAASKACGFFSDVFATGVGLVAAGAASETGPGAVAIGVNTYRALAAGLKVVCGGIFGGGASSLGKKLEADHETHIALNVVRHGECIKLRHVLGAWAWGSRDCA